MLHQVFLGALLAATVGTLPSGRAEDDPAALLKRAEAALAEGAPREAVDLFRKARKLDPAVAPQADWGLARAALAAGDRRRALELANALARKPSPPDQLAAVQLLKGLALSKSDAPGDLDAAEDAFRAAAEAVPTNPAPLYNLGVLQVTRGRTAEGLATLGRCREIAPGSDLAQRAARILRKPGIAGKVLAPDFTIHTLSGDTLTLAGLEGKVVLLDFWATWCPPCVASVGELRDLRRKWPEDRLALVSVSVDRDEPAWRQFVASHGMTWPQYRDANDTLTRAFRVSAFPTYVLLDPNGAEIGRISGLDERHSVGFRLQRELQTILGQMN
ncbi:MAG TPA: TlpA disulfide reductase family protein [Vicinamibacteria bacterium]|nr:TlpA disulfide reductase family protein [Vicinamibacteria bacterium]